MKSRILCLALALSVPAASLAQNMEPGPKSPQESLKCMKPRPGFKVELMAAEPLVMDPIAFAWGPDGKFWVVEMGDYPLGADGKGRVGGRVKFLTKSKEDGPYDKMTVFLDNLGYPTGVTPWGKGVLVTCAPDIFYAEDTDGDGKADKKEVLYTGFGEGNQQHRVNGLVYGLDNWLYGANGDSGGKIKSIKTGEVVDIRGRDFRIKPDEGLIQAQSGQTQFGRARDDWGNWFGNNNSNPMWHYVLDDFYLKRNPHVLYPDPRLQISVKPGAAPVYPVSKPLSRFNTPGSVNHFTSACSAIIYRDDLFGPEFAGNSFVSEPVHNLIHREIVKRKGVTFTSQRADDEQKSEFLASTDNWFRPTTIHTGPDGALWVADMYRYVIEHPQWIPLDWQKKLDLRAGHDMGRIYRIFPEDNKPRAIPRLDKLSTKELVATLESPNGWTRDMAQQLLVKKDDPEATPVLQAMLVKSVSPRARLHALCTLDGLERLHGELLAKALLDSNPDVRCQAIRCSESFYIRSELVSSAWSNLAKDSSPKVRLQLAYSVGMELFDPIQKVTKPLGETLGTLLSEKDEDRYVLAAAYSSLRKGKWPHVLEKVLANPSCSPAVLTQLLQLAPVLGEAQDQVRLLAFQVTNSKDINPFEQFLHLSNLLDALEKSKSSLSSVWEKNTDPDFRRQLLPLKLVFAAARATVTNPKAPLGDKMQAVRILGRGFDQVNEDMKVLGTLLVPQMPEDVQSAVIQSLAQTGDFRVPAQLLKSWKSYSPALRSQAVDSLLSRLEWTRHAVGALERKEILPTEIDVIRRQRFLDHKDSSIRTASAKIFAASSGAERSKIIDQYLLPIIAGKGDAKAGSKLFAKHCATCHQLGGVGVQVGPDLASVADKTPEGLLTAILDPNKAVEARYVNYVAATKEGVILSGMLLTETSTSITLITADGKKHGLLRTDLDELASTGKSAMPEGFEKDLPPPEMVDLIAFLRSSIPIPKRKTFPGNQPETLKPASDGALRLTAKTANIFGKTLVFEEKHHNLGYWSSPDDHATWTIDVPKGGTYTVSLHYACSGEAAGNQFVVRLGKAEIQGKVASTAIWDNYLKRTIGQVQFRAGMQEVRMEALGPVRGALLDLKEIELVPMKEPRTK